MKKKKNSLSVSSRQNWWYFSLVVTPLRKPSAIAAFFRKKQRFSL